MRHQKTDQTIRVVLVASAILAVHVTTLPGQSGAADAACAAVSDTTSAARVRKTIRLFHVGQNGRRYPSGGLETGDLVRIVGHHGATVDVAAPISDAETYAMPRGSLCALATLPALPDSLFPFAADSIDTQVAGMLSLQGIPRDAFLRSAVFEAEEPDLAGNPIRVSFLAGSYYEKRGFLIPNALGWYDQIGVHYEAIEPLAGPRDLGNAAEADVRQGHDSRSRMLLALRDPDSVGAPIVIYAASYSGGIRYVMAYTTDGYGQWVEYRCQRSAPVLAGRSEIQIRDVERTLVSVARTICDPMLSPAATSTAPPAAPMMLAGDWVATSHSVGKVGAPLGDYFDTGDVVRECNGTAHFKPVDRQQLNEHATHYGRHSLNVAQGQIASYGDHAYILTLDSECVDSVLVGRDVGHLRATHVKVDFAVAAQEEDTLHVWTDDGRVAFALTPDGWLFKSSNCQASGDRTKVPCGARLLISRKH